MDILAEEHEHDSDQDQGVHPPGDHHSKVVEVADQEVVRRFEEILRQLPVPDVLLNDSLICPGQLVDQFEDDQVEDDFPDSVTADLLHPFSIYGPPEDDLCDNGYQEGEDL